MPKWTFENKITLGNLIQIGLIAFACIAGYFVLVGNDAAQAKAIGDIQEKIAPFDSLNIRLTVVESRAETQAQETAKVVGAVDALVDAINADRLSGATKDAEIKKDVGFLRDWVEEQKRAARP